MPTCGDRSDSGALALGKGDAQSIGFVLASRHRWMNRYGANITIMVQNGARVNRRRGSAVHMALRSCLTRPTTTRYPTRSRSRCQKTTPMTRTTTIRSTCCRRTRSRWMIRCLIRTPIPEPEPEAEALPEPRALGGGGQFVVDPRSVSEQRVRTGDVDGHRAGRRVHALDGLDTPSASRSPPTLSPGRRSSLEAKPHSLPGRAKNATSTVALARRMMTVDPRRSGIALHPSSALIGLVTPARSSG